MPAGTSPAAAPPTTTAAPTTAAPKSKRGTIALGVLALGGLAVGAWFFLHRGLESTDDAFIDAEVVGLSSRTNGVVTKVLFEDNQKVEAGAVLVELDPEPAKARLAQAEANLEGAKAALLAAETDAKLAGTNAKAVNRAAVASLSATASGATASRDQINEARARLAAAESTSSQAKLDFERIGRLAKEGAVSQAQLDQSRTQNDTAAANLAQARASLTVLESTAAQAGARIGEASAKVEQTKDVDAVIAMAEAKVQGARARVAELTAARDLAALDLSYTKVLAPQAGFVSKKNVTIGQTLGAGSPIAQMVPAKTMWVTANFKETQIGSMKIGQGATLEVDAFGGKHLKGSVESFSAATGSKFALLPPDNATGNFTKVVQRVPVRIKIENPPEGLRPGMSVELTVDTR
jgi:membrane fusion protein (multidrug efflux system)